MHVPAHTLYIYVYVVLLMYPAAGHACDTSIRAPRLQWANPMPSRHGITTKQVYSRHGTHIHDVQCIITSLNTQLVPYACIAVW